MRVFYILRNIAILAVALLFADERAEAQSFGLGVSSSASSLLVSNSLTYTITVTNLIAPDLFPVVVVSNVLPASVEFTSALASQGSFTNYGNVNVFYLGQFVAPTAQLILTVQPDATGFITNSISVVVTNFLVTPAPTLTNIVTQVTNTVPAAADLAVTMTGPLQAVIVNDWMTYQVAATNLGPDAAANVRLTNTLPPGVLFKSVSPNLVSIQTGSNRVFSLGTINSGGFTSLQFTVQPTNAGALTLVASVGAAGTVDPNLTNNLAATNVTVLDYLSGPLFASTNSAQNLNLQNGLTEQSILLSNNVGTNVGAVRIIVTNLTKRLVNAVGTNDGNPFVVLNTGLPAGETANLLLQFSPRGNFPLVNSQLQAFAVPPLDLTPPAAKSLSKLLNITRIVPLASGNVLIEFPSTLGKTYTVVYSDNASFSNAAIAPPAVVAPASQVQWIDYGPPGTTSAPTNAAARFYRVFQNQ